jgi:hypothetical protein
MTKKPDAERAIRYLATKWYASSGQPEHPSFPQFCDWLQSSGYGQYLTFRSSVGTREDTERWFDEELHQTWRN